MTVREFLDTMADGDVIIRDEYKKIVTWHCLNGLYSNHVLSEDILNSKICLIGNDENCIEVTIDYEEENE